MTAKGKSSRPDRPGRHRAPLCRARIVARFRHYGRIRGGDRAPQPHPSGRVDWFRDGLIAAAMISPGDMDLVQVGNEPEEVVDAISKHYETRGFVPLLRGA